MCDSLFPRTVPKLDKGVNMCHYGPIVLLIVGMLLLFTGLESESVSVSLGYIWLALVAMLCAVGCIYEGDD